jgi:tetratricopeptide (TPR) repeat protein
VIDAIASAEKHLDADFDGHPAAEAIARQAIGATWRNRGEFVNAAEHLRRAEALAVQSLGPTSEVTLDIRNSLLLLLSQMGQNDESIQLQEKVVAGLEATVGPMDRKTLAARHNLAIYHAKAHKYETGLKMLEQVHADRVATIGAEHAQTLTTVSDIAELNLLVGNPDKALKLQEELVQTMRRVFGEGTPQTLTAQYRLACLLQRADRNQEAITLHEAVIPKLAQVLGERNITTLDAKYQLARCYLASTDADRAVSLMREYFKVQSAQLGETSIQTLRLLNRLAAELLATGQLAGAEEFARRAVAEASLANSDTSAAFEATALLGEIVVAGGRLTEGESLLTDAITKLQAAPSLDASARKRKRTAMLALARIYEQTNRAPQAEEIRAKVEPAATKPGS